MILRPEISFEQYAATCEAVAAAKSKPARKRSWAWTIIPLVVWSLFLLDGKQRPLAIAGIFLTALAAALPFIAESYIRRSRTNYYKRRFNEEKSQLSDQMLTLNSSGVHCLQASGVTAYYPWTSFHQKLDLGDAFVYLPSPNSFVRIPKVGLSEADLTLLNEWSNGHA